MMKHLLVSVTVALFGVMAADRAAAAELIVNGGFEVGGLANWTVVDQAGGSGSIYLQTGTGSPLNGFTVAAPPGGTFAAMSDQFGPGAHVLYQDFVVPVGVTAATFSFQAFINNLAGSFFSPASLDFGVSPNQQARVDIITTTANPFSVLPADVLQNLFQTMPGDASLSGYSPISVDVTALLAASGGQTLRLRFAEVDNLFFFNFGIDDASIDATSHSVAVPEPASMTLLGLGVAGLFGYRARRRMAAAI